ncbi:MAG TPA: sigma-70 family RNA polymerase sigma factor [Acidimicrobiales bacterium]|nr:sigma-70 family RNA polymerase sigma factor [Acidimicrobiales bacterium]
MVFDELELVVAARKGDQAAFSALVRHHGPRLGRLARAMVGEASADDVVQETVLAAWKAMSTFRGEARFGTWIQTICYRQGLRESRRGQSLRSLIDPLAEADRQWADEHWSVDPAQVAARAGQHRALDAAIEVLPPMYRTALVLHDVDGLAAGEVAAITGVALATAKTRIRRARMALVSELARRGQDAGKEAAS